MPLSPTHSHWTVHHGSCLSLRPSRHIYHTQVQELEHTGSVQAPGDKVTAMFQELGEEMEEPQVPALYLRCTCVVLERRLVYLVCQPLPIAAVANRANDGVHRRRLPLAAIHPWANSTFRAHSDLHSPLVHEPRRACSVSLAPACG